MSIIKCPECSGNVSDKAFSCPHCGYPLQFAAQSAAIPITTRTRSPKRRRKLPNGFGSIKRLSGPRKNPFAAYPPVIEFHENGSPKSVPAIGYYRTYQDAYDALSSYNRNPYNIDDANATFANVYEMWLEAYKNNPKQRSYSAVKSYSSAFKNCAKLHNKKFKDIRKVDMQVILDTCPLGYSSITNIKKLFSQLYKFALENDIVQKDYSKFTVINRTDDNEKGEPFSKAELQKLWNDKEDPVTSMIILMCFTGFRISEFVTDKERHYRMEININERYLHGGLKTEAGENRIVPFQDWLTPYVQSYAAVQDSFKADNFRIKKFYPKLIELGIDTTASGKKHTPHDCRHTFSWICDVAGIDSLSKHLIMGHSLGNDVEVATYGHRTLEDLHAAISKIDLKDILLDCC